MSNTIVARGAASAGFFSAQRVASSIALAALDSTVGAIGRNIAASR